MKKSVKKQVLLGTMLMTLILSGSFITVNATTKGQLVEGIKDTIKVIFVKVNNEENQLICENESQEEADKEASYVIYSDITNDVETQIELDGKATVDTITIDEVDNSLEGTIVMEYKNE